MSSVAQHRASVSVTPDCLDTAILDALREHRGAVVLWSRLRDQLPAAPYWRKVEALCRLHHAGQATVRKAGGETFVSLPVSSSLAPA